MLRILLLQLCLHAAVAVAAAQGQGYDDATLRYRADDLSRRIGTVEALNLDARVRVLESDMSEVKWLARGVTIAVAGQLIMATIGLVDKKNRER